MVCYIIMTILGICLIVYGIKKSKVILVGGALLAAVGLFLVVCTIILLWGIRNQEPIDYDISDDDQNGVIILYDEEDDETGSGLKNADEEVLQYREGDVGGTDGGGIDGESTGADWRTWRSYSEDYVIGDGISVCLAGFEDRSGYAVYDSKNGDRVGSLVVKDASGNSVLLNFDTVVKCEDIDGDGLNELGVEVSPGETVWFHYTDEVWKEGIGGGCFKQINE